jgi:predicted 3-demethylubiquinone-9 3-methyltransferase (glyoxalase superfamily)
MQKITPFLWFDGNAEEAMNFYVATFKSSKVVDVSRHGDKVFSVSFELDGQRFMGLNGGPMYRFSEAISMFVDCETQDEVDHLWDRLVEGGTPLRCGWLTDRFGLTWQIIPSALGKLMRDPDPAKSKRVVEAMMKMVKLDIAALERAHGG